MTAAANIRAGWPFGQVREWLTEHEFRFCGANGRGVYRYRRRGTRAIVEVLPALREITRDERPCVLVVRERS